MLRQCNEKQIFLALSYYVHMKKKIETQTIEIYNERTKISRTNFLY